MDGSFACPECGNVLVLKGLSPGRQVRCSWCEAWVEVPYLPRSGEATRFRARRRPLHAWIFWTWIGLAAAAVVIVVAGSIRMVRYREQARVERALAELTATAEADERAGQLDEALTEFDQALQRVGGLPARDAQRIDALRRHRDELARRLVKAQLVAAATEPPDRAIDACARLLARAQGDPALEDLVEPIREQLDRSRQVVGEADLAAAQRAFDAGRLNEVIDHCDRLVRTIEDLRPSIRRRLLDDAKNLVTRVVARQGVVIAPIRGVFARGSEQSYTRDLRPMLVATLRERHYVPRSPSSSWRTLWDQLAPYQLAITVVERQEGTYLQSANRPTIIEATITLSLDGTPVWNETLNVHTQGALPKLTAYQSSRLALSKSPEPELERLLYENAHQQFLDRLGLKLHTFPESRPITPAPEVHPSSNALGPRVGAVP